MQYRPRIDHWRIKRSIDEKPLNPNKERGRKNKRLRLGLFSINPEQALPLQKGVKQFHYCELSSGQVSRSFLMFLGDPVDLVCSWNRGSGSRRLDVHPERGNNLHRLNAHRRESGLVHWRESNLLHRRNSGLVHRRHSRCQFDN